jgi:hypothetical protein
VVAWAALRQPPPCRRDHTETSCPGTGPTGAVVVSAPLKVTCLPIDTAPALAAIVRAVGAPAGTVGPVGGGSVVPPELLASAASCASEPLNRLRSTFPPMPDTRPLLVRCQNVQVGQPPGTIGAPLV